MRGMAGGLVGGMLGSMLFGGMAHGMGGGIGGSGMGLLDLLIIGGIIYFIYTRFVKKKTGEMSGSGSNPLQPPVSPSAAPEQQAYNGGLDAPAAPGQPLQPPPPPAADIDEEEIKELAQDIFFRVQAAWMNRDIDVIKNLAGPELTKLYEEEFRSMKEAGRINRLENIAVRNVEILEQGVDDGHEFIKVRFTANLLDYTIDEASGEVVEGDRLNPVKFRETWTLARPSGSGQWRLYGIEE
jgi:predicted lipid-binding transport protein (Tim44 family)